MTNPPVLKFLIVGLLMTGLVGCNRAPIVTGTTTASNIVVSPVAANQAPEEDEDTVSDAVLDALYPKVPFGGCTAYRDPSCTEAQENTERAALKCIRAWVPTVKDEQQRRVYYSWIDYYEIWLAEAREARLHPSQKPEPNNAMKARRVAEYKARHPVPIPDPKCHDKREMP